MFTGIIEELGTVEGIEFGENVENVEDVENGAKSAVLRIAGPLVATDATHGASIAVNGVCLTVTEHDATGFAVDVMPETLRRSSLGALRRGGRVNLERAMPANGRFGGHVVQGHVDGTARVAARTPGDRWEVVEFRLPPALAGYVVEKGSITVDGVSLTVASVTEDGFGVSLIPTTLELTTLGRKEVGERVNIEVDILAKYVERLLAPGREHARLIEEPTEKVTKEATS